MKLTRICAILAGTVICVAPLCAALIPSERLIDWTPGVSSGVPGGIASARNHLIDVTQAPYNADKTGVADTASAIQAAINAAVAGDVVYLPAGRYRVDGVITLGPSRDNITVRGAGAAATVIDARVSNTVFSVGSGSDYQWNWPSVGNEVTAGLSKGSTELTISDTSAFSVGQIISVAVSNQEDDSAIRAGATPTISVSGYEFLRRQNTRVVGKTANKLYISPALYFTPDSSATAHVNVAQMQTDGAGIEDMTLDGTNGSMIFPIMFQQCYGCWIKGVKVTKTFNYGLYLTDSLNCEVRHCEISERKVGGSNGAGVLMGHVSACLIEDNIILQLFPAVEVNFSSMGNVVAYNVMENSVGGTLNTNHSPHNSFNLYEGNVTPNIQCDGYFGGTSDDTFYRNWIHGTNLARSFRTFTVSLNRFTRNYSLVGNIIGETGMSGGTPYSFGNPNLGNSSYSGTSEATAGDFWSDWKASANLAIRTSDNSGVVLLSSGSFFQGQLGYLVWGNQKRAQIVAETVSGNRISFSNAGGDALPAVSVVRVFMGPGGYQALDLDVQKTTVLKANYSYTSRSIAGNEALGGETLPSSLYRSAKPGFFGNLGWPAFDPLAPAPDFSSIPAGYRYANGGEAPGVIANVVVSRPAVSLAAPSNLSVH